MIEASVQADTGQQLAGALGRGRTLGRIGRGHRGHQHIFQNRALRQQVMRLKNKPICRLRMTANSFSFNCARSRPRNVTRPSSA